MNSLNANRKNYISIYKPRRKLKSKILYTVIALFGSCKQAVSFQPNTLRSVSSKRYIHYRTVSGSASRKRRKVVEVTTNVSYAYDSDIPQPTSSSKTTTRAVYALMVIKIGVFMFDKVLKYPFVRKHLYFHHADWSWWQPLTACFCHGDTIHLGGNLFFLLLFGRQVEKELGWDGLILSYTFCGIAASFASLLHYHPNTVYVGASGALFGLFAISTFNNLSWNEIGRRKLIHMLFFMKYILQQLNSGKLVTPNSKGRRGAVLHAAHWFGAATGVLLVSIRALMDVLERSKRYQNEENEK